MNIIQINDRALPGRRFNGYDLCQHLNSESRNCSFVSFDNEKSDNYSLSLFSPHFWNILNKLIDFEQRLSMNALAFPMGRFIRDLQEFKEADIVHYHLIHNYLLSLLDFPELTMEKLSIWTIHDPWAFTGHCVHPQDCMNWRKGCKPCPRLKEYFPMRYDKAWQMWNLKKLIYSQMNIDIVIASKYMEKFMEESPLTSHFERVHLIPFGIKVQDFGRISKVDARSVLKIPNKDFVIAFRSEESEFKGLKFIMEMLRILHISDRITLLTVGLSPLPKNIKKKYNVIELGWQDNPEVVSLFYSACDVFLMPSMAESFGLMAIEAMASSRPVVVFEGTALPSVTFAPECGIAVPRGDSKALKETVERLMVSPEECKWRGEKGRELAEKYYRFEDYVNRHIKLYEEIVQRKKSTGEVKVYG